MTLNEVRLYTAQVIAALHAAGRYAEGFALGDDLNGIGFQPLPHEYLMVLDTAERMAADLAS